MATFEYATNVDHIQSWKNNFDVTHSDGFPHNHANSKYKLLYINMKSLGGKLEDLELFIHQFGPMNEARCQIHIIAVTDIQLFAEQSKFFNIPGYVSFFTNNDNGSGGAAIFVHVSLAPGLVENDDAGNLNYIQVYIAGLKINVGVLYNNPSTNAKTLKHLYEMIFQTKVKLLLVGHYNFDLLHRSELTKNYINYVYAHKFSILNRLSSEFATGKSFQLQGNRQITSVNTIQDHIISNLKGFKYDLSYFNRSFTPNKLLLLGFNDHRKHDFNFHGPNVMTYKVIDQNKYARLFFQLDCHNANSFEELLRRCKLCQDASIIYRTRNRCNPQRRGIYYYDRATFIRTRSQTYARNINRNQHNPKRFMDTVNGIVTNQPPFRQPIKAIKEDHKITLDKLEIANILNKSFKNIGRKLSENIPELNHVSLPELEFNDAELCEIRTTPNEIRQKIGLLKSNNNISEYIPSTFLKQYANQLAPNLAKLFNECYANGTFPRLLKISRVVPVFKGKDPLLPENYRPISIPQNLSKLFEMIIYQRIADFCFNNRIINKHQYGFQKNSNSECAIVRVLNHLQMGLSQRAGSIGACVFVDLKKASETIPHNLLLKKLCRIGIRGKLHQLLTDFLHMRRQFVDIDHEFGSESGISHGIGIPQGSILGPFLFLIYINDIFQQKLRGQITLFGDDTNIVYVESNQKILKHKINRDMNQLYDWFTKNKLTMNTSKTKIMFVNPDTIQEIEIHSQFKDIEVVDNHKFLGIILQSNLKWDMQVSRVVRELNGVAIAARRIGEGVETHILRNMHQHLVHGNIIRFAAILGTFATEDDLNRLQLAQDEAIRNIFWTIRKSPKDICNEFELLRVREIIKYDLALLIYKLKFCLLKLDASSIQQNGTNATNVLIAATRVFYSLPDSINNQRNVNIFKMELKSYLLQQRYRVQ